MSGVKHESRFMSDDALFPRLLAENTCYLAFVRIIDLEFLDMNIIMLID